MLSSILFSALLAFGLDPAASRITFSVERTGSVVEGSFTRFTATASDQPASIDFRIESASIDTANAFRDEHLRSDDFLDAARFPEIRFTSSRIERKGSSLRVDGALTIHGITRNVSIPASVKESKGRVTVTLTTSIRRSDFGVGMGDWADRKLIGDEVTIRARLVFVETAARTPNASRRGPRTRNSRRFTAADQGYRGRASSPGAPAQT